MKRLKLTKKKIKKRKRKRTTSMYTILTGKPLASSSAPDEKQKFRFKSGSGAKKKKQHEIAKSKMMELADCLVDVSSEWKTFDEGREDTLSCLDELQKEARKNKKLRKEVARARLNISRIETLKTLTSYVYQLKLKLEGLSVNAVLQKK